MSELRITIGAWTVSPALNLIERGGESIKVEPRAMDVLMVLVRHGGAVVSVDQLIATAWKGVVVGDGSVYLAISQLRQALEGSTGDVRYIETIPKRGYRLTVPVERATPELLSPVSATPAPTPSRVARFRWLWLSGAAVAGTVLVAILVATLRDAELSAPATSVAVLPFDNLSSDPEQEYFADGITDEILNNLARIGDLRVTGRTSSFQFKNRTQDLRTIGAELGVEHILEGSVRKVGDQVRVTAQLSNSRTGYRLWSETYQRRLDDIFSVQDEIAVAVADALQVKLGVGEMGRVPGMTRDVAAYDEYLRGMSLNLQSQVESRSLAIAHLQRSVALDPSFSVAWAGLSTVYINGSFLVPDRASEWRQKSMEALEQARALTPDAPHVLLEMGIAEARRGNWLEAAALYERLKTAYVKYGMNNQAWGPSGVFLLSVGRVREAIDALERARAEDPLAPAYAIFLSDANLSAGNLDAARAEIDRGLGLEGLDPSFLSMGLAVALAGHDGVEIGRWLSAMPDSEPAVRVHRRLAQFIDAPAGAADEIRGFAGAASPSERASLAVWAAYYREPELSLELLATALPDLSLPSILWSPLLRDVRRLPAFKDMVREHGLVEYWRRYGWGDFCRPLGDADFVC